MKKFLSVLLAATSILSFAACGKQQSEPETTTQTNDTTAALELIEESSAVKDSTELLTPEETTVEEVTVPVVIPTEKEVLDKFKAYIDFAHSWIYTLDIYDFSATREEDSFFYSEISDSKGETAATLKKEIRKYFESGEQVELVDNFIERNGKLYFRYKHWDGPLARTFIESEVTKNADGTFKASYVEIYYDCDGPVVNTVTFSYRPNNEGEWYFYKENCVPKKDLSIESWYKHLLTNENYDYFDLIYVNNDDIPELFLSWEDYSTDGGVLYIYDNGMCYGYHTGYNGTVEYVEKGNIVCFDYKVDNTVSSYRINGSKELYETWTGQYYEEGLIGKYYSNGKRVSHHEYNKLLEKYYPENRTETKRIPITEENISKYIK